MLQLCPCSGSLGYELVLGVLAKGEGDGIVAPQMSPRSSLRSYDGRETGVLGELGGTSVCLEGINAIGEQNKEKRDERGS